MQASAVLPCDHRCELTEVADSTSSGVITGHGQPKVITVSEHHAVHATGESVVRFEVAPWFKNPTSELQAEAPYRQHSR